MQKTGKSALTAILMAAFCCLPAAVNAQSRPVLKESAETLAKIPEDMRLVPESISARPDQGKIAYVCMNKQGFRVCVNGECTSMVERVARGMPVISPDGKHWAAVVREDGKARVMLNGDMSRGYDMVHTLTFSPNSMKVAYLSQEEKDGEQQFRVHVNQETHKPYAIIDPRQGLVFSRDSKRLAYAASPDGEVWHLVEDGKPGPEFEQIKHIRFSPDSQRLAYAAKKDGKWHLVENGKAGPGYNDIKRVAFGPESENLACIVKTGQGSRVVKNVEKSEVFEQVAGELVFSSDGQRLAYTVAEKSGDNVRMRAVVDGKKGPAYEEIGAYRFSPDGRKFAYMAVRDGKGLMVVDGKEHPAFDSVGIPVFGPESKNLAYMAAADGRWFIRKNGENSTGFDKVENPIFSPDGKRMAHIAKMDEFSLVVEDGKVHGAYNWAGNLTFSPDGKYLVYTAAKQGESFLAVEGTEGEERFFSFLKGAPVGFMDDNTVRAVGLRDQGKSLLLLHAEIMKQ